MMFWFVLSLKSLIAAIIFVVMFDDKMTFEKHLRSVSSAAA